jgi:hypothetical protein
LSHLVSFNSQVNIEAPFLPAAPDTPYITTVARVQNEKLAFGGLRVTVDDSGNALFFNQPGLHGPECSTHLNRAFDAAAWWLEKGSSPIGGGLRLRLPTSLVIRLHY